MAYVAMELSPIAPKPYDAPSVNLRWQASSALVLSSFFKASHWRPDVPLRHPLASLRQFDSLLRRRFEDPALRRSVWTQKVEDLLTMAQTVAAAGFEDRQVPALFRSAILHRSPNYCDTYVQAVTLLYVDI